MKIDSEKLKRLVRSIFAAAGCKDEEAGRIGHYLIEANLVGHDSHGVMRVPSYLDLFRKGDAVAGAPLTVIRESPGHVALDARGPP